MKTLFLLFLPVYLFSQEKKWYKPFISDNDIIIYSAQFMAGAADGLNQTLVHHPLTFKRLFPNANMNWWLPEESQNNKKHFITVFSDAFHLSRCIEHTVNYFSIAISFTDIRQYKKKQLPLLIAKRMIMSMLVNRASFKLIYNVAFNDKQERPH